MYDKNKKKWTICNPNFILPALSDSYLYYIDQKNTYICTRALFIESALDSTLHNSHINKHLIAKLLYSYNLYKNSPISNNSELLNSIREDANSLEKSVKKTIKIILSGIQNTNYPITNNEILDVKRKYYKIAYRLLSIRITITLL